MLSTTTKTVWLKAPLDEGCPGPEHFEIRTKNIRTDALNDGELILKVMVMSADPYLRGQIKSKNPLTSSKNATEPPKARAMRGFVAGKIMRSKNKEWVVGDYMGAALEFSTVQRLSEEDLKKTVSWKLTGMVTDETISLGVGVLGMPGSTAYGGLIDVLRPIKGQTLFVSAASGAVGSIVGQIGKNVFGLTTIGSCGGPEKAVYIKKKFGFDASIDYKKLTGSHEKRVEDLTAELKRCAPEGIDMYFENVGGVFFESALAALRPHGRIAVCGCISGYNAKERPMSKLYIGQMIYTFQRIEGFVCSPWLRGERGNFLKDMGKWVKEGKVNAEETFFEGIESWPLAFQSLFTGKKRGKVVVRIK